MFGFGLSTVMAKTPIRELGYKTSTFYKQIIIALLSAILLIYADITYDWNSILFAFVLGIIGAFAVTSLYKAISLGKVGIVHPIAASNAIIVVVLSYFLFNETMTIYKILGIFLIICGIIFINFNIKDLRFIRDPAVLFALAVMILWGIEFSFAKFPILVLGAIFYMFINEVAKLPIIYGMFRKDITLPNKKMFGWLLMIAVTVVISAVMMYQGFRVSEVTLVAPIIFSSPLVAVIAERIFYKVKLTTQQYASAGLIILGIIIINYFI